SARCPLVFFFQAEDGIRDFHVTGVQTCALPISRTLSRDPRWMHINARRIVSFIAEQLRRDSEWIVFENQRPELYEIVQRRVRSRSEERRVGKACGSRRSASVGDKNGEEEHRGAE